jgi:hypothetical protein
MKPTIDRHDTYVALEETTKSGGLFGSSMIMTAMGERPVSSLVPGDRIITRDRGMAVLEDTRTRRAEAQVVRIAARSLGHNRPEEDTYLPEGQRILIRDWRAKAVFGCARALVPVERLVDGEFVTLMPSAKLTITDLLFDDPHILYVDGLEVASYIDEYAFF